MAYLSQSKRIARYIACPLSGAKETGSLHGLTLLPIKKSPKGAYHWRCGFCNSSGFLSPDFNPSKHGYTYETASKIAQAALDDGIPATIA